MKIYDGSVSPEIDPGFSSLDYALVSGASLFYDIPDRPGAVFRPTYNENADSQAVLPLNTELHILPDFLEAASQPGIDLDSRGVYWLDNAPYDVFEALDCAIQSVDLHDQPLPRTVLPPQNHVHKFIDSVQTAGHRVTVDEQFDRLLSITNGHVLGAANLGMIATRFMARGAEQRAYPNIPIDRELMRQWNNQIAQFKTYDDSGRNDGPGDTYYFWTHVFGTLAFDRGGMPAKIARAAFSHGTEVMRFVRKNISRTPTITNHREASLIGRAIGQTLVELKQT